MSGMRNKKYRLWNILIKSSIQHYNLKMSPIIGLYQEHFDKNRISTKSISILTLQLIRLINYLLAFIKAMEFIIKTNELDAALKEHNYE